MDVVPLVSLVVVPTYYDIQIRNQNQTRRAQMFMQYYNKASSRELMNAENTLFHWEYADLDDFMRRYGPESNPEAFRLGKLSLHR